jgi:hypothetical protein
MDTTKYEHLYDYLKGIFLTEMTTELHHSHTRPKPMEELHNFHIFRAGSSRAVRPYEDS